MCLLRDAVVLDERRVRCLSKNILAEHGLASEALDAEMCFSEYFIFKVLEREG